MGASQHRYPFFFFAKVDLDIPALQLIGVSVIGLEPEFQPVVNHLLPHIMSHKQDAQDMHLQVDHIIYAPRPFYSVPYKFVVMFL